MDKVYFNLSFDDIHPESSVHGTDCGGDRENGVFKYFLKLWDICPELKVTLFTTPNWEDRANDSFFLKQVKRVMGMDYTNMWEREPFLLTKHKKWCRWINSFGNFEVTIHGYNHHVNNKLHSQEFQDMSYADSLARLKKSERFFKEAGLNYVRGFRPPGWGISDGMFQALYDLKYDFISIDSLSCRVGNLSRFKVQKYKGLVNVPQNWDIARGTVDEALDIAEKYGLLMAKGHISNYYDGEKIGNGLNEDTYLRICELLERIKEKDVKFVNMRDIGSELL